jgi:hypothetical protein
MVKNKGLFRVHSSVRAAKAGGLLPSNMILPVVEDANTEPMRVSEQ